MWIRDGALQLGALIPRMSSQPFLRLLVEGAVRTQVCCGRPATGSEPLYCAHGA